MAERSTGPVFFDRGVVDQEEAVRTYEAMVAAYTERGL